MAKKKKAKRKSMKIWKLYEAKGELKRKNPPCPKCGPGFFLGVHKNRNACGRCGYTEMKAKPEA